MMMADTGKKRLLYVGGNAKRGQIARGEIEREEVVSVRMLRCLP